MLRARACRQTGIVRVVLREGAPERQERDLGVTPRVCVSKAIPVMFGRVRSSLLRGHTHLRHHRSDEQAVSTMP
jgi:hypothetical protein